MYTRCSLCTAAMTVLNSTQKTNDEIIKLYNILLSRSKAFLHTHSLTRTDTHTHTHTHTQTHTRTKRRAYQENSAQLNSA